jgi:hypothetical protein
LDIRQFEQSVDFSLLLRSRHGLLPGDSDETVPDGLIYFNLSLRPHLERHITAEIQTKIHFSI